MSGPANNETVEDVRVALYDFFATRGRAPTVPDLASATAQSAPVIRQCLSALHASRDIVLSAPALAAFLSDVATHDANERAVVMAHPFASIPFGFSVMGKDTLWWGGCAWDSFALAHLVPAQGPLLIASRCPGCELPLTFSVDASAPPSVEATVTKNGTAVAHFLTPMACVWNDVVKTCSHQCIFCSESCVDAWVANTGAEKGYVMSIETLWHFAADWYTGRLQHGYKRREPSAAKDYFRSVGLEGPFWGL